MVEYSYGVLLVVVCIRTRLKVLVDEAERLFFSGGG